MKPDDPEYQQRARDEAEFWASPHPFGVEALEGRAIGPMDRYTNRRFTGDPSTPWYEAIARFGSFHRGLIIGASGLKQERRILETNPALRVTFCDISPEALARRERELGPRFPGRVDTIELDLNFAELEADTYDLIVSSSTMHHITNLEHAAVQINRALTADGRFFLQDYVGETRHQFSPEKKRLFELIHQRHAKARGVSTELIWKDGDTSSLSPFCCIRSGDILQVLREYLIEDQLHTAGTLIGAGVLVSPAPSVREARRGIASRLLRRAIALPPFAWRKRAAEDAYVKELIFVDGIVCDAGILAPHNAFAVYRKRP